MAIYHAYFDCSDEPDLGGYRDILNDLLPMPAFVVAQAVVDEAFAKSEETGDEPYAGQLLPQIAAALEKCGVETSILDEELTNGYILVVRY